MNLETPEVLYARSGDVSIAYQTVGDGPVDVVFVPFLINLVWAWEQPIFVDFCRHLASFSRLILLDKRGTGLSDRPRDLPSFETRMDDIRAVMDDAGSERAALLGAGSPGGQLCAVFAATYPERVAALFLHNTWPRVVRAPDFPHGEPVEVWHRRVRDTRLKWGTREYQRAEMRRYFPSFADDPVFEHWHVNHERLAASPGAAAWFMRVLMETDIREVLPTISVPTLMLYHRYWEAGCVAMAERIQNAETIELTAPDISTYADTRIPEEVKRFLGEGRVDSAPERVLTTVLFTDIVDSTSRAAELGDRPWRELLSAHHATVRAQLARYGGKEIRGTGDGFFATFEGPARAIACAHGALEGVGHLGLDLRAGIHTGEVELVGGKVEGIAVHIGARIAAEARPREVLVSSIVRDLAAGSGIEFEDRGVSALKGVPGEWRLFAARLDERARIG
ncbi:MAG TPA: adenylate/guanylate cyclase domain-containing protein [Thermoleophilaceae bacterium]|nr:adenylate/guanylate cyclase domain-containing protein [Thermoleophilaceae bacterium]